MIQDFGYMEQITAKTQDTSKEFKNFVNENPEKLNPSQSTQQIPNLNESAPLLLTLMEDYEKTTNNAN